MWVLLLIILSAVVLTLVGTMLFSKPEEENSIEASQCSTSSSEFVGGCCGNYEVCDNESLLSKSDEIVYYDDEELDAFVSYTPYDYSEEEIELFRDVLYSMQDDDVAGWLRSLQLRNIELPVSIREDALLIITDLRSLYQIAHAH